MKKKYYIVTKLFYIHYIGEFHSDEEAIAAEERGRQKNTILAPPTLVDEVSLIELKTNINGEIKNHSENY